ncbi:hypothetical protein A1O1_05095 [Capronia coronata CBS 617.96]|uniref:Uncharacterized protein n=1 Tax=Capronia coronata CBS 617.96 TaxID=1182541 RepID=W9Y5Q7_9EURO|nr:uncharacterized protein A1O1_05095 [Capronia coronata CBS 617.96]EXJ88167.1 hypothetical protein A1O1_05095 [Capronia coronata CBS 617.96]
MSNPTVSVQLEEEYQDEPDISPDHYRYIRSLNESASCYTRFFDALLIPNPSHSQFMRDLKSFREQPAIINLLQQGTKDANRGCTSAFVISRFAHPWCRTTSDFQSGWTRASWMGTTKKVSAKAQMEEDRLHRLLVPLWIAFRRRMFPEPEVLAEWVAKEEQSKKDREAEAEARALAQTQAGNGIKDGEAEAGYQVRRNANITSPLPSDPSSAVYPELGFKAPSPNAASSSNTASTTSEPGSGAAATQMFLGVAVTGFIMSDKRVRKYVEKKLRKK